MEQGFKIARLALHDEILNTLHIKRMPINKPTIESKPVHNLYYYSKQVPWETVKANLHKTWNWRGISGNPNISWEIVKAHPDKHWDRYLLSENPAIYVLSKSEFVTRWHAANVIKRAWFRCVTDPSYEVCKARLLAEFTKTIE